uniref:butyrophilin subfamily 3 member A3-like isoform X2 n=1 Tax=Scatophagus argus TaxID=75038 RepID=UPI001ED7FC7E|nr:butyrophilin subfamily 3 member A3-like isoform X2 [Scatophagus argus]
MVGLQGTTVELLFWCFCHLIFSGITAGLEYAKKERVVVPEGDDALLPCSLSTKEDLTLKLFDWKKDGQKEVFLYEAGSHYNNGRHGQDEQFKGRVFHFEDKLKNGDASIKIINTKVADSGNYTCDFPLHQPRQTFLIELVVDLVLRDRSGEISGAAAKPFVTVLHHTNDWSQLQCKVLSARPEPTVKWQDSAGNKLPAKEPQVTKSGNRFSVILLTTVSKTDDYHCVVTQEEISHQTEAETHVYIHGAAAEPESCTGSTVAAVFGTLAVAVVLFVFLLVLFCRWHIKRQRDLTEDRPEHRPEAEDAESDSDSDNDSVVMEERGALTEDSSHRLEAEDVL